MLAAKGYICKSDKEERIRNNLIDIDDRELETSHFKYGSMWS
jgi:hypothetical protein